MVLFLVFDQFNHYVVSLAHHVVSLWFLSCKFPLRKQFVRFIVQGFRNNVLIPCEEGMIAQSSSAAASAAAGTPGGAAAGDGGSDAGGGRVRSGSLSSHDARRTATPRPANSSADGGATKCIQDETRITFHRELMETCADLMSRYTYGNSAPYAQQSETVARILKVNPCSLIL